MVNQLVVGVTIGTVAEGLVLAARPSLRARGDPGRLCSEPGVILATQLKDLDTVLDVAHRCDAVLPLTEQLTAVFRTLTTTAP